MYWSKVIYRVEIGEEEFQSRMKRLIDIEEANLIKNHWHRNTWGSDEKVRGKTTGDKFIIWRTNRSWNGVLYPIFIGKISRIGETAILKLEVRFNRVAEIIVGLVALSLIYGIVTGIVIQENNELKFLLRRGIVGVILFLIFQTVPLISFYSLKNQTLKGLEKYFELRRIKLKRKRH